MFKTTNKGNIGDSCKSPEEYTRAPSPTRRFIQSTGSPVDFAKHKKGTQIRYPAPKLISLILFWMVPFSGLGSLGLKGSQAETVAPFWGVQPTHCWCDRLGFFVGMTPFQPSNWWLPLFGNPQNRFIPNTYRSSKKWLVKQPDNPKVGDMGDLTPGDSL